ncbi:hypothetical protein HUG15_20595 [Salicibibacter cibarius]|uniref:Membrane protein YkvI n=1 Tax=Salicibibacter cibarius TaxID=2743000 RepID=A0A7T6Z6C0_9BACI|nr:hypothetical protein [Salicibibacter cibarius]QQK77746.1 hypothetical protein HUG15_20595 [Salicibibacter cibarius]
MKNVIRVAGAYVGIIIGAGFASGQEIVQYFASFGLWGIMGTLVTTIFFPIFGYQFIKLGQRLQVPSHKKTIYYLCGKYLGPVLDIALTLFLFGFGVVMIAGSGSLFEQQFAISPVVGYVLMIVLVALTMFLNTANVTSVIGYITPYMVALTLIVVVYSLLISDFNFNELDIIARDQISAGPHWLVSSVNYVALCYAISMAMMIVIGATEEDKKSARLGGIVGGIIVGLMVVILNLALYANIDQLQGTDMPTLALATEISPILGTFMAIGFLGMIFNTAVAMFYSFTARFVQTGTPKFKGVVVVVLLLAFPLGFVGFVDLVNTLFPLIGYVGFVLVIALFISMFRPMKQTSPVDKQM